LSGSYQAPWNLLVAGTLISNTGFPYLSTYSVTKAAFPGICTSGCAGGLVRASQFVFLSARGDERLPTVTQLDLRVSRAFNFGRNRRIVPQLDLFNVLNSYTPTSLINAVGATWRQPSAIISPRIARVGFAINF
jgi:hypothetical protein